MKISHVRTMRLTGIMEHAGEFWEERLTRPVDIYPEHKVEGPNWLEQIAPDKYRIVAHFVEIETDQGVTGIGGPIPRSRPTSSRPSWSRCSSATIRWPSSVSGIACIVSRFTAAKARP